MPDIRTLLHDAAPKPFAALDMTAVLERAARRPRRRLVTWIAGLGAVVAAAVGVGVPGGGILLNSGQGDVATVVETDAPTTDGTVDDGSETGGDVSPAVAGGVPSASPSVLNQPAPAPAPVAQPAASTTSTTEPSAEYPPAASCSVDSYGLGDGDSRSCRFTATAAGGWNYYEPPDNLPNLESAPTVYVIVIRSDGTRNSYRTTEIPTGAGHRYEGCADDIIEPGDRVEVTIYGQTDSVTDTRTEMGGGAGQHWGCTDPGP